MTGVCRTRPRNRVAVASTSAMVGGLGWGWSVEPWARWSGFVASWFVGTSTRYPTQATANIYRNPLAFLVMTQERTATGRADDQYALCATTNSPEDTRALARAVSGCVADGDLLVLAGDLGAGKTCFSQGFGAGLGISDRMTSPTFTLHNQYQGRLLLNHLDVYRIDDLEDTLDLDLPEMLESGVTLIEWGEQIDPTLPTDHLVVRLLMAPVADASETSEFEAAEDDKRLVRFEAGGPSWGLRLSQIEAVIGAWSNPC